MKKPKNHKKYKNQKNNKNNEEQQKQFKTSPVTLLLTHLVRPSLVESELSSFDLQQKPAKTKLGFIVNTMVDGSTYAG